MGEKDQGQEFYPIKRRSRSNASQGNCSRRRPLHADHEL